MLDKTNDEEIVQREVDKTAPALFVRMSSQVGPNHTMEMSFGVPLDMTVKGMNGYIDKVTSCIERQNEKGILAQLKHDLIEAHRRLQDDINHLAAYEAKQESDWYEKGRKGPWQPTGSENAQIKGFRTNIKEARENAIPNKERMIAEYEEKIARGT